MIASDRQQDDPDSQLLGSFGVRESSRVHRMVIGW